MNTNFSGAAAQNFFVTPTAHQPTYATTTAPDGGPSNQSFTATVSPTFINTSGVSPSAPVMTSTQHSPQQLAQSPIDGVVSFLMSPDSESVQSALAEQSPIASVLQKIMVLLGIKPEVQTLSAPAQQALLTLKNMIQQARPDFLALKNQVSQFVEQTIQGQNPNNPVLQQALTQAQAIFKEAVSEAGGLVQFLNKPEAREALNQIVSGIVYQTQLVTNVYSQLKASPQIQALTQGQPLALNSVLNNLIAAVIHHGAPAPLAKLVEVSSQAILQMVQTIFNASDEFANAMGMTSLGDSRAVHPSVLKDQPESNLPA